MADGVGLIDGQETVSGAVTEDLTKKQSNIAAEIRELSRSIWPPGVLNAAIHPNPTPIDYYGLSKYDLVCCHEEMREEGRITRADVVGPIAVIFRCIVCHTKIRVQARALNSIRS